MSFVNDDFVWPADLFGNTPDTRATFRDLLERAWDRNTWDLKALSASPRCVLDDSTPILVVGLFRNVDSAKARRTRQEDIDVWSTQESIWHLNWFFEDAEFMQFSKEDPQRFLTWLLQGMEHLWVCVGLLGDTTLLWHAFPSHFLPSRGTVDSPVVEAFLMRMGRCLKSLVQLEGRLAVASNASGLIRVPTTVRFGMVLDLLTFTGRDFPFNPFLTPAPLREICDAFVAAINKPPGKGLDIGLPEFRL